MNNFLEKKEKLKNKIIKYKNKIIKIENDIINIDKEVANFSKTLIFNNLELSKQQNEIINSKEDNILVIACPGSGKTHTLISKYIKMISNNEYNPEEIILITFTKKAGNEMLNRLTKLLPNKLPYYIGSIHGLSYKILHEYNNINYIILDDIETKNYIINIINNIKFENLNIDEIELFKQNIPIILEQTANNYPYNLKLILKKNNLEKYYKEINLISKTYNQNKKLENIIDFNDLMILFNKFLEDKKSEILKNKIKYIFFDEYQDVNSIQNNILLKLSEKSKIMLVGDDAQAIYSFRGSSVEYILNFKKYFENENKLHKIYLLEENYRSTPLITDFCQNIIKNNINKINKTVISKQEKLGIKPCIYNFSSKYEQYNWIINDILDKNKKGISFSNMVILARKNNLLDDIELNLLNNKIPTIKHLGLSLLNKSHIKDFLAFIIILINSKSTLHWKRIILLHPNFDIQKANIIINKGNNILENIKLEKDLLELYNIIIILKNNNNDLEKTNIIINYLEKIWNNKNENKKLDIMNLLKYLKNYSLNDFISNLYLNLEVETNNNNILYLTTIHGAKGLEWDYVYIIDMTSKDFPLIRNKYYLDELEDMEEERRLFYVASSRAKKNLIITYYETNDIKISPLIKELDNNLYNGCGVNINNINKLFILNKDINNYLIYNGYSSIYNILKDINNLKSKINLKLEISKELNKNIIDIFLNFLIYKMIQINFYKYIDKFEFNKLKSNLNLSQEIYLEYIDEKNNWKNILEQIYTIAIIKNNNYNNFNIKNFLLNPDKLIYYLNLEKELCKIINNLKPNNIKLNYCISYEKLYCEINIICNNNIIEIISNNNEIFNISNICKQLIYAYLLKQKNININDIIIFNPINGHINKFNINNINLLKFKENIYN